MAKKDQAEIKQHDKLRPTLVGEVVSDKMSKTIVVKVTRTLKHPVYGKTINRFKKYKVHDEQEIAKIGDEVEILFSRPLSKTKHMILGRVLSKHA